MPWFILDFPPRWDGMLYQRSDSGIMWTQDLLQAQGAMPSRWLDFVCVFCESKSVCKQITILARITCRVPHSAHQTDGCSDFDQIHLNVKQQHPLMLSKPRHQERSDVTAQNNSSWHSLRLRVSLMFWKTVLEGKKEKENVHGKACQVWVTLHDFLLSAGINFSLCSQRCAADSLMLLNFWTW